MLQETVVVVAGGHPSRTPSAALPPATVVIAADGGIDRARSLGLVVDIAVGDFDSVTPEGLADAEARGARIERHPAAKDATDLELALDAAIALVPSRIVVVGSDGGRLDHLVGSLLLLADERYARAEITAFLGADRVDVVRGSRVLPGQPGRIVSLLPVHGAAEGVTTDGLEFPLRGESLPAGTSRGTSNVFTVTEAHIGVARGCLLAIQPAPEAAGS
jgi:thiamine pyrophosphokinase